jgi:hypothetical protein
MDKMMRHLLTPKFNADVWNNDPKRAEEEALKAILRGGFGHDCLDRRVGNYEGQIMAIERGWVDPKEYQYVINSAGIEALKRAGHIVHFLPGIDTWHGSNFEYCVYEEKWKNRPVLRLFTEAIPKAGQLGMCPVLDKSDVVALRNYLNDWIKRTGETA